MAQVAHAAVLFASRDRHPVEKVVTKGACGNREGMPNNLEEEIQTVRRVVVRFRDTQQP